MIDFSCLISLDLQRTSDVLIVVLASLFAVAACSEPGGSAGQSEKSVCSDENKQLIHTLARQAFDAGFTQDFSKIDPETVQAVQKLPAACQQYKQMVTRQIENINDQNNRREFIDSLFK